MCSTAVDAVRNVRSAPSACLNLAWLLGRAGTICGMAGFRDRVQVSHGTAEQAWTGPCASRLMLAGATEGVRRQIGAAAQNSGELY